MTKSKRKVIIHTVYSKRSHLSDSRHGYPPVRSEGVYKKDTFEVTVHMTPELRRRPKLRKQLLRHEKQEAKLLAEGKSVNYSHRQAASRDPKRWHGEKGWQYLWTRLGKRKEAEKL